MEKTKDLKLIFDGEEITLQTALIGGITADALECPMGMYAGKINPVEVGMALLHVLRATIKISRDQWGFPMEKAEDYIVHCLAEAFRREENQIPEDNVQLNNHKEILADLRREALDIVSKRGNKTE